MNYPFHEIIISYDKPKKENKKYEKYKQKMKQKYPKYVRDKKCKSKYPEIRLVQKPPLTVVV